MTDKQPNTFMGCLPMLLCNLQVGFILLKVAGFLEDWDAWQVFSPALLIIVASVTFIAASMMTGMADALSKTERD